MHRRQRSRPTWFAACAAGVLCLASGIVGADAAIARPQPETLSTAVRASCPVAAADRLPTVTDRIGPLRTFSADELQRLVDLTSAAAVSVATPPPIFGDPVADARIRQLAEARGYRPRSDVGISGLVGVDGRVLESATASAWRSMKAGAAAEGISLTLSSGYRSTARQRSIFLGKLAALGLSASTVRAGRSDAAIESVLRFSSIPGYSRHHTAHTIDVLSPGYGTASFGRSPAFAWLAADNYANAKRFGFVPSYPPSAGAQGPDPEPWEYVFVGIAAVSNSPALGRIDEFRISASRLEVVGQPADDDDRLQLYLDDRVVVEVTGRCSPGATPGGFVLAAPVASGDICVVQDGVAGRRLLACSS